MKYGFFCLLAAVLAFAACDSADLADKTLPDALDLPLITLAVATTTAETPGLYNVEAYITTRAVCTNVSTCGQSFVVISDIKGAGLRTPGSTHATIFVDDALQFRKDDRYRFSFEITIDLVTEERKYALLGYDAM